MGIRVESTRWPAVEGLDTEFVERKGIGHPDSLMDGIAEAVSEALCREYVERAGAVLHHNVDKGLIVGGASKAGFGKGKVTKRMEVITAGRATAAFRGMRFDVNGIAMETARDYLERNTRYLDVDREAKFSSKLSHGSSELTQIFGHKGVPLANDTAFGLGFAPFSELERLVLETERYLNSSGHKKRFPSAGEDIKVMGLREGKSLSLTLAVAFVSEFTHSLQEYFAIKEKVRADAEGFVKRLTGKEVEVVINNGDDADAGKVYLTKTGLSCEAGDDGQVGRGNRANGLITPFRRMSLEAVAGKNPVNHVGKIYNVLSMKIAGDAVKEYPDLVSCDVQALAQIGASIDRPRSVKIDLGGEAQDIRRLEGKVRYLVEGNFERIASLSEDIRRGKYRLF